MYLMYALDVNVINLLVTVIGSRISMYWLKGAGLKWQSCNNQRSWLCEHVL